MLGKRLVQSSLAVAVCVAMVMLTQTSAQAQAYGPYYLISEDNNGGHCLDDPNSNTSNNTRMVIWDCLNGNNQRWYNDTQVAPNASPAQYWIKNQVSGKCLTVQNASMDDNAPVIQYTCNAGANEVWYYDYQNYDDVSWTHSGYKYGPVYKIRNQKSQKCLTVTNNGITNGSTLVQFTCSAAGHNTFVEAPTP